MSGVSFAMEGLAALMLAALKLPAVTTSFEGAPSSRVTDARSEFDVREDLGCCQSLSGKLSNVRGDG